MVSEDDNAGEWCLEPGCVVGGRSRGGLTAQRLLDLVQYQVHQGVIALERAGDFSFVAVVSFARLQMRRPRLPPLPPSFPLREFTTHLRGRH